MKGHSIILNKKFSLKYVTDYFDQSIENYTYVNFHLIRYQYLINLIHSILSQNDLNECRILDIGPMHQTNLIRDTISGSIVDTMGQNFPINHLREYESHFDVDLNETDNFNEKVSKLYDILVFSEVIEHLYTKPEVVLGFLKNFMKPGGFIIIQTPNGLAIHHRLKLLIGIHPFQLIKETRRGHYREYAAYEMRQILENCDLQVNYLNTQNYFNNNSTIFHRLFVKYGILLPSNFRDGITIVGQKI